MGIAPLHPSYEVRRTGVATISFRSACGQCDAVLAAVKDASRRLWRRPAALLERICAPRPAAMAGRDEEAVPWSNQEADCLVIGVACDGALALRNGVPRATTVLT